MCARALSRVEYRFASRQLAVDEYPVTICPFSNLLRAVIFAFLLRAALCCKLVTHFPAEFFLLLEVILS